MNEVFNLHGQVVRMPQELLEGDSFYSAIATDQKPSFYIDGRLCSPGMERSYFPTALIPPALEGEVTEGEHVTATVTRHDDRFFWADTLDR